MKIFLSDSITLVCPKVLHENSNVTVSTGKLNSSHANITIKLRTNTSWRESSLNKSPIEVWAVQLGHHESSKCNITYYAIHGEPECLLEGFTITCSIDKVYPKALCHFNITYNDSGHVYEHITYHHEELEKGTYYKTSCTYWSKPVKEKKNVTVTLYPNVTGKKTDMQYGKTKSLNLLFKLEDGCKVQSSLKKPTMWHGWVMSVTAPPS
ncbi:polymorphic transmembrane cluster 2 transmembrane protein 11 [Biomphalaria pfeifferi]|uniref:Polymorphic transmembrane cluster 2 transmembrane protein 11 n=1 Tax=Biomphalaria pfeifferi TaxID=112525 RepID=A0AAD8FL28_BIOPF|nr:polymorphic transmembrane cluster 2 transmembrane protein 11 [Biomphalaria pfeifferi]